MMICNFKGEDTKQHICIKNRTKKQSEKFEDEHELLIYRPQAMCNLLDENETHYSRRKSILEKPIGYEPLLECATKLRDSTTILAESFVSGKKPQNHKDFTKLKNKLSDKWPNGAQLNYMTGLHAIQNYMESIKCDPLKFCVDFLENVKDELSSTYIYEVKWSMPTKEEPIPMAAANMYFSLRRYHLHPAKNPIEVTYVFESSNLILRPGDRINVKNKLMNIIQAKLSFIESSNLNIMEICKFL